MRYYSMRRDSIILIGMAGVGKSTVGRELSEALGYRFVDLDICLEEEHGQTPQEIIDAEGESVFLAREKRCMQGLALDRTVVAPGGSIIYHTDLMAELGHRSTLVYLEDTFENISSRVTNQSSRGIVGLKDKTLRQVLDERLDLYSTHAHIKIDCRDKQPAQIAQEVAQWLKSGS